MGCHLLLQGTFLTQGSNSYPLCLLPCRRILYPLRHLGSHSYVWMLLYCTSQTLQMKVCSILVSRRLLSTSICLLCVSAFAYFVSHVTSVIPAKFQTFSLLFYLLRWPVINDLCCYYCQKIMTCWRLRWWWTYFSNKVFLINVWTCSFRYSVIAHSTDEKCRHNLYSLRNQNVHVTCFIVIFNLLQWSKTEPTISLKSTYFSCFLNFL